MTLRESTLRVVLSLSAPLFLLLVAAIVWLSETALWVPAVLLLAAMALGWFVLFDFATSVTVDDAGITRRCPGNRHLIEWPQLEKLLNPRRRGLVAVTTDGKHHILIDRKLSDDEMTSFAARAASHGVEFEKRPVS